MLHGEEQKKKEKINPLPSYIIHLTSAKYVAHLSLLAPGDTTTSTSIRKKIDAMIEEKLVSWHRCTMQDILQVYAFRQQSGTVYLYSVVEDKHS